MLAIPPPFFLPPLNLTFVGSTSFTADTVGAVPISIDAGWLEGDLAVYYELWGSQSGAYTSALVAGWTQLAAHPGAVASLPGGRLAAKVLSAADIGTTPTGSSINGSTNPRRNSVVICLRPNRQIKSLAAMAAFNVEETNGDPVAQTVDATAARRAYVGLAAYGVYSGTLASRSFTSAADGEVLNGSSRIALKYRIRNHYVAGESYGIDMGDEGSNSLMSGALLAA